MGLQLISGPSPSEKPVTVAELKGAGRISTSSEDSYIQTLLDVAVDVVETYTSRKLILQSWKWTVDYWPDSGEFLLPLAPVAAITALEYYNTAGSKVTWAANQYQSDLTVEPCRIWLAPGVYMFPLLQSGRINPVEITFQTGYANAAAVPAVIKRAIQEQTVEMYNRRQPVERKPDLFDSVERLLYPYRVWDLG